MNVFILIIPVVALLVVMSIVLLSGRGSFLIAGYNTAGKAKRESYDEKKLCRLAGTLLLVIALTVAAMLLFITQKNYTVIILGFSFCPAIILASVTIGVIYANKKCLNHAGVKNIPYSQEYKKRKRNQIIVITAACILTLAIVMFVTVILIRSNRPVVYSIENGSLHIQSEYGENVAISDIAKVQLKSAIPVRLSKITGLDLGSILKGKFQTDSDEINVYVDSSISTFIYMYTKSGLIIINDRTKAKTQDLYNKLSSIVE